MNTRQEILEAFKKRMPIETFVERVYLLPSNQKDCILIDWSSETISASFIGKEQEREIEISVNVVSKADKKVSQRLDEYSTQIESAIDIDLGGLVDSCELVSIQQSITSEGERPIGSLLHVFRVRYQTRFNDSSEII